QNGINPRHADIQIAGDQLKLVNLANDAGLTVNGKACNKESALNAGDQIVMAGVTMLIVDPKDERKVVADVQTGSGWAIRANHSALANKIYSINSDTTVGRAPECDLSFSVSHISRKHAQLSIINGQLVVKDLASANGTFVNGKQVNEAKLQKGDELRLDTLSFTVIGPGGDSDKTTVRMAVTIPPVAKAAAPAPSAPANAAASAVERERKRAAGTTRLEKVIVANEEAKKQAEGSKVGLIVIAVALFVTVAAVAYTFI
ncbi:MAG TPA: FHA domain-containing protein, partial [Pseudomonadales bacterium]|nr:FHA domain-containing protein [Pseudomonadales bacterium]